MPVLDRWMDRIEQGGPVHPGILHMYIHALEMSPVPQRALKASDMLRGFAPDAGHLEHMPAHIYVLCGDYAQSIFQSERAVCADDKYLEYAGDRNFYTTARCHALHLCMYAAMFLGQYGKVVHAAHRIGAMATPALISGSAPYMASMLDGYARHVHARPGALRALACLGRITRSARPFASPDRRCHACLRARRGACCARPYRGSTGGSVCVRRGRSRNSRGCNLSQQHRSRRASRRRGHAGRRAGIPKEEPRSRIRESALGGFARRRAQLHRTVVLDAFAAPCAGRASGRAGHVSGSRSRVSRGPRP